MLKEIYEQSEAVAETIGDRVRHGTLVLEGLGHSEEELKELRRIVILACGTAYHAGVVGRYVIEEWARIPVEPDIASEWIYRNPVIDELRDAAPHRDPRLRHRLPRAASSGAT